MRLASAANFTYTLLLIYDTVYRKPSTLHSGGFGRASHRVRSHVVPNHGDHEQDDTEEECSSNHNLDGFLVPLPELLSLDVLEP